jgi:amino acid transporter
MPSKDEEKAVNGHDLNLNHSNGNDYGDSAAYAEESPKDKWPKRVVDSFRRDPNAFISASSQRSAKGGFDHEAAARATANSGLARKLKGRHLQMIAIGGSIGE